MTDPYEAVKPGTVWADNDKRSTGRTVRVDHVAGNYAYCTVLSNRNDWERDGEQDKRGREVRLSVRRMRPVATGWTLVGQGETP